MVHRNGTPPAPHATGGAFPYHRPRTEFLPDLPVEGLRAHFYHLHRQHLLGIPLIRWLYLLLVLCGFFWGAAGFPGGWWGTALWLLSALALWIAMWRVRRQGFVRFHEGPVPPAMPAPLPPSHKVPVYASGKLAVENRARLFAGVPGFYRTFATREHALLCQARPRQFLIARWPNDEEGLWYAFFMPDAIQRVRAGDLYLAQAPMPALAIDYRPAPVPERRRGAKLAEIETLFLAFQDEEERISALSDLLADAPKALAAGKREQRRYR